MDDRHTFALCLTHDVDRPYKTFQSVYYALAERDPHHLRSCLPGRNPYWQFEEIMELEDDLGVRSAFYFLHEQRLFRDRPISDLYRPDRWKLYLGRYAIDDPEIAAIITELDAGGWEVGLHGSYESYNDPQRLGYEKARLEDVLGKGIVGGRQHYLNLVVPDTWQHHARLGLKYDTSLGSTTTVGFNYGYDIRRPFDDEFVVFPLTIMESALPDPGQDFEAAWQESHRLLMEAAENSAVMTILWHPRYFNPREFPGYRRLYRRIIESAHDLGAWIGPPAGYYDLLEPEEGRDPRGEITTGR